VNTNWTMATTGNQTIIGLSRSGNRSIRAPSGTRPHRNPTTPALAVESGSTILGNAICLISCPWETTELLASPTTAENHFQGTIAAKMNSG